MLNKPKKYKLIALIAVISIVFIAGQSYLFSAYEAHVINVTARICRYSETRTPGYWKTHPEVYEQYLYSPYPSLYLGPTSIPDVETATEIFENGNAKDMRDKLKSQLLGMKFNILHYGVGEYYIVGWGTIDYVVWLADQALLQDLSRGIMEEIKNVLDYVSNLHRLTHCIEINPGTTQTFVITGLNEPSREMKEKTKDLALEAAVAGISTEPPAEDTIVEQTTEENVVPEEPLPTTEEPTQSPEDIEAGEEPVVEEQGVVEEVAEALGDVVGVVVETVVDVVENILGIEPPVEEPINSGEENSIILEEPVIEQAPIEQPTETPTETPSEPESSQPIE